MVDPRLPFGVGIVSPGAEFEAYVDDTRQWLLRTDDLPVQSTGDLLAPGCERPARSVYLKAELPAYCDSSAVFDSIYWEFLPLTEADAARQDEDAPYGIGPALMAERRARTYRSAIYGAGGGVALGLLAVVLLARRRNSTSA